MFCRRGNRPQLQFRFLARRLRCAALFERGIACAGRRQRFLDRGQPAAGAGQLGGQRRRFLAVRLERGPVLVVDPFKLGFPVTRLAAGLVNLKQAVFARAFKLDEAGRILLRCSRELVGNAGQTFILGR